MRKPTLKVKVQRRVLDSWFKVPGRIRAALYTKRFNLLEERLEANLAAARLNQLEFNAAYESFIKSDDSQRGFYFRDKRGVHVKSLPCHGELIIKDPQNPYPDMIYLGFVSADFVRCRFIEMARVYRLSLQDRLLVWLLC